MANKINIYNSSAIYDSMVKDGFLKADKLSKEKFLTALEYNPKYMPRVRAYAQRVYGMSPEDFDNLVYTTDYTQDVSDLPPSGSSDYVPSMPWDNTPAQFSLPYKTKPGSDNNLPGLPAHDNTSQPNFMRDLSPENVTRRALANAKPQPMQYLPKEEWDKEIRKKEAIQQGLQEIAAHSTRSTTDYSQPISVKSVTHPSDLTLGEWYNSFASDTYSIQKGAGRIYQMWQVGAIDEDEARSRFHQLYVSPQTAQSRNFVRTIDERRNFRRNNAAIDAAEAEITSKLQAAAAQKPTQPIPMPYMGDARISDSIDEQYYKQSLRFLDDARKISRAYADNNYNGTSTAKRVLRGIGDNLITPEAITMGFSAIADNANLMRILEKDERGEQLSDAEETLLSAAIIKQYTEAAYASGTGIAYNIGAVTGESLPYMLSFVVTGIPIKAATSGISKRIVNFVGRQLQRKGIGRAATRATKAALGLGGNIATSALQAPIMPSTYSDYLDRRIGTIDSTTDGMGNISFSHQGDNRSTAALKAYFNTLYQNFGERSGEAISSLWGMFGRGIGKIPIGRGKSINDIFNTIHDSRLGKFWDTMQGTAVADFMRQANYDGVFAEVVEEYVSGILNAATIGDQSFEELFSQDNLLTTMGGIALTSVMLGSANATLGVAATQRIRTNFNRSSKAAQQYFSPEQLNQLIGISGGSVQDITTFLAANIARRQLIARQISQLAARQRNGETGIEAQINTLGAELQDLRMQYDFVNASAMYNAYIGGLSRRIEPMREQARAAIRANGDPATGLTIQVDVNGRQGYLIGGNYNHIQDSDGNISVTPTGDLATVLFDGDKTPTPNIPMETISILGVRRTDDVIRDGDRAIFAATEHEENAAQAPATGSTVTVSGSQGNFILQGYDPQGNAIVTPLNTDGTPAVKNGNPITASVPSENIIPEEAGNTSSSIRTGSIAYIDGIPYSVDQVDGENAIIHRLNTDGTPVNDEQGNPVTSIVPIASLSTTPDSAQKENGTSAHQSHTQPAPAAEDNSQPATQQAALSQTETDDNELPFVIASDGTTTFGMIARRQGMKTAPIKLSIGFNKTAADGKNHGYGLEHIESAHGRQIRDAGFLSVPQFVEHVAKHYNSVKKGKTRNGKDTFLLELTDSHNNTLFIELANDGSYWNVNSAGIFRKEYSQNKETVPPLPAVRDDISDDDTGVQSTTTDGNSMSGNSPATVSQGKDTQFPAQTQGHSPIERIPIDKNGKPIYEQSDPETAYDAILEQADGDTALASRVILSMIDNKEAALNKLSKAKPRRADNPADIINAEKELAAQIKQAESDLQFWKNTALVPSLRNQAQKEAEANSVIQDPSLADTPDSRTRDNDGSGNHQGIGAIQADVASTQENSEERLTHEEALAIISDMEKHAEVAPEIELTPENWVKEFGNDGIVNTPIGEVKQGDNQYLKLAQQGRNSKLGMVRPTLERPSIIILDERPAREGKSDRDTSFVFIKTFIKEDGTRYYYFTSVTVSKKGKEVVISSQERSANRISKLLQQGKIAWIDTAFSLHPTTQVEGSVPLNDSNTPTVTDNQPALLGINSSELSQNKDNEKSPISSDLGEKITNAEAQADTNPTEAQKEAGNYRKGHVQIGKFNVSIENPKGSVRSGVDVTGREWTQTMQNTYGYIRGTEGVDGDHIDVFLANDIDGWNGSRVFVIDQYNEDGTFDEHKVMIGFNDEADAQDAYLSNYEKGWENKRKLVMTSVNLPDFENWINSSHRKTKPFAEYQSVNGEQKSVTPADRIKEINARLSELKERAAEARRSNDIISEARIITESNNLNAELRSLEAETKQRSISKRNLERSKLPLTEKEYANKRSEEIRKSNPDIDEIDAYNQAIDEYPSYILDKIRNGELEKIYEQASINDRIKLGRMVESAGYSVSDISSLANKKRQDEKNQNVHNIGERVTIRFYDGTIIKGDIISTGNGSVTVLNEEDKRKYTVPESRILSHQTNKEEIPNSNTPTKQARNLPGMLKEAYRQGNASDIAKSEADLRAYIESQSDLKAVAVTYFHSEDNMRQYKDKNSPEYRMNKFIADACKNALLKAGIAKEALMGERKRVAFASTTDDARTLDVMSIDPSYDVLRAVIRNPHTSDSVLRDFTERFQNNGLDYEAQQVLDERLNKKENSVRDNTTDTGTTVTGKQNDTATLQNTVSDNKDSDSPSKKQTDTTNTQTKKKAEDPKEYIPKAEKIEDVGEKIGGARKDIIHELTEKARKADSDKSSILDSIRSMPVSKIFNFDYERLRKDGVSNELITLLQVIREIIPSKPRSEYKLRRWTEQVFELYYASLKLITLHDAEQRAFFDKILGINQIDKIYQARMALGGFDSGLNTGKATLEELGENAGHYDKEGNWVSLKGHWYVKNAGKNGGIFPSRKEAEDTLRTFAGENASPENSEKKTQFSVYRRNVDGTAFITVKGKPSIIVADGFKNSKEALDYLKTNYADLDAKYRSMKEKTNIAFRENRPRKGRDWRNGKNISAEEFRETFGFRGVEFGNWTNQEDRQQALNNAFDAFMDLADAIGKSPRSLSLNGQLGIAFGARGGGRAAAHYEPDKVVINLTKTQGAGSLAHEWWHAIDNYFARRRGQQHVYNSDRTGYKYNTEKKGAYSENERQELTDAFKELMNAINNSSYGKRSKTYASMKSSYWSRPTELGARAFAIWIERKLSERGTVNDFLANNPTSTDWGNPDMVTKYYPYPIEGDFDTLDTAFDNLFNAIQEEVDATTGNTILFHHGDVIGSMTAEQRAAFDAVMSMLKEAGVPVEVLSYEQMRQLADMNGAATRKGTKKTPETDSAPLAEKYQHTAISSADGSKVLKNLETLAENYENSLQTKEKTFIGEVADALNIERTGASSRYATFETKNGQIVTIRLSNHNATVSNFDNASEQEGISIVVSPKKNTGINNDGNAHVVEFYYDAIKLRKADGKPLAQIVRSIQQALYSGEYRDTTGLAVQEEVNGLRARLMTVYHGSGATFEQFDHSHIGEGEGVQAYGWGSYVTEVEDIGRAYAEDLGNKVGSSRNLYTVEIPDDTGNNYLWWEKTLRQKVLRDIARKLEADYGDAIWVPEHLRNMPLESKMRYWMKETYPGNEKTGEAFYNCLSVILGSDRAASEFLSSAGFTGISYPAQYTSGGREDNARNYVIFNEENLKITDHVQFLKDRKGVVYGAAVGGKIYLNASALNPETPIHEYTHLWDEACRRANPELWQRGVELMKQTQLWNEVKNDPNYVNLLSDDEIASEVHARLTGRDGAKLLERMVNEDKENGVIAAANAVSLRERLKKWLSDFWYWLKDSMTPWSREQASKISLSDFVNIPLTDLIKRTNILFREIPDQSTTQEQTNDRFNNELSRQIDGTLPKGHIYDLGMPSDTLLNAGLPNLPIEMAASRLSDKSMQENHPFDLSEIRNLPKAIQSPMAIFRSATHLGSFVVMTEIEHHGRNFVVAIQANRRKGRIEVNSIRSVYPKNNNQIANWVTEGLLEYADKKRMVEWLSKQRSNSADVRKLFNHATNIIQNFDNPKNNNENIRLREMAAEVADAARPAQVTRQIERLAREMNLPIEIIHSIDDIPDEYTRRYIQGEIDGQPHTIAGYYDRTTGKAYIILPAILQTADPLAEAERTILHEVIAHHGMQALMGRDAYDTLCDEVWNSLPYETRARFAAYVLRKNPRDLTITDIARVAASPALRRAAADEYIAALAEGGVENPTLWQRIKAFFRSILRRMHLYSINPTDADIRYLLSQARENLAQTSTESAKAILQESNDIRFKYTNVDGINMSENAKKALEDGKTDVGKELELAYFIKESGLGTWNGEYHHVGKNYNRHYFVKLNDGVTLPAARKAFKKYLEDKRKAEIKAVLDKYPDAMTRQQVIDAGGRVFPAENRTHKDIAYAGGEYWYIPKTIQEQTNDRFNDELQQQIDGTLPEGHIYQLGRPGEILLSAGFPDMPIEMSATRLAEKSQQKNHPFDISAVRDLVKNMNDPIAVFKYGNNAKNVIIGIEYGGKQFLVGVHFNQSRHGVEVNDIRGIFPKDNSKWLNWISQGKADYLNKEEIQALIDKQRTNLAEVEYLDLDSVTKIIQNFDNPKPSDPDIRLRELSAPEETMDNASRQGNDYARDARTHAAASIDTHNPDLSPSEQAEAVRFRELLTRDFSAASDFLNSANLINAAMQANDGKAAWFNNIQEAVFDSMLRLRLLLDRMKKDGASIPAGFNPYLAENQSRSRAQNRIAAFNEDYRRPLIESLAKCINKLREENIGVAIKDNNAAHEALSLYAQARAAVERQEVKEREAREQAKADGTEYKHREWAGLPGIQYAIIALYKGEITDDVEANKNNLQWLQDFATENNIPTVEQYITMVEDALQKENIDNLWENIRRISEFQLTTSRDAGILSRGSYQLLTYGYNIDEIIETLYKEQRKKITDDINNGIGDKDSLAADLADLDRRHLEAVATATDLDAPDAITTLVAGGWITQDIANDIHRYYNYYLPLKGHAEITGEDLFDYNTPSMPRNASRIKSVRGHEQLARDPFNQILRDAEGCIMQAERNRWKQQLYHVLSTNRSLANGQYAIQRKYYQVIKLDDGTVRYEPYQRVVTTENNEDITTFVPTAEEIAAGTAVLLNSSAEFDIYVSQKQRSEHETIVYIDGSPISILFYDARIAKAVNGTNEAYPPQWMPRAIIKASRTIPALLTSWHLEFVLLSNPIRDTQEAIANAAIDKGFKYTALLARNLATVDRDLWAYTGGNLKQKKDNGQPLSQYEKYVIEFFENGGSVNVTQLSDYETTTKDLKKELKRALKGGKKPSKNFWKRLTEQTELRSRIATYITSRQTGSTIQDAINDAKEITVNFDRRGAQFRNFNLLQMFFNAQMQSVRRQTELMRRHPVRYATTVAILASSKVLIGLGISLLLGGGDDDNTTAEDIIRRYFEINKQLRTRNHIFIIDGEVYRIPVAPAFIPFTTLCEEAAQLAFDPSSRHRNTASQALLSVTSSVLETYVPTLISDPANIMININNEQAWRQSFASGIPMSGRALWQPFIEAIYNYDYTGNPIYTEPQFGAQHLPFHRDYRERTGKAYVYTSKLLSDLTGGNNIIPGKINIHPEQIEHVVQGLAGGIGTLAGRFTGIYKRVQGESAESTGLEFLYDIPFAARLYGGNMQQRENRYYQSLFFDDKQALEAFRAQQRYIESSQDMQDFNKEYNSETRKYFYDFATADKLATKVRKWRDAHQKESPEYKQYEAILQDIYRTTDDAFNRLQQSNDNEPYEIIDNPYYIYNNIESQLDKELYNVNGTFMTIDDAARAWAARTRRDKKQYYTLSGDLRQIAKIRDEVKEIKKLFKEIGSDYYPGMPLNGRQQYIYRRIEQKTKALSSLYDEIALDNIQLIE